jgi:hypothetical protein
MTDTPDQDTAAAPDSLDECYKTIAAQQAQILTLSQALAASQAALAALRADDVPGQGGQP